MNTTGTTRPTLTPSRDAVSGFSAIVRNARPILVCFRMKLSARDHGDGQHAARELRDADHHAGDVHVGLERHREPLGIGAERNQDQVLEDQQKAERGDERNGVLSRVAVLHFEVAEGETLDQEGCRHGYGDADQQCHQPGPCAGEGEVTPRHQRPGHHSGQHEQRRDREVEKVEHADGQCEGDRNCHVDRAEQKAGHDLAHDHRTASGDRKGDQRHNRDRCDHWPWQYEPGLRQAGGGAHGARRDGVAGCWTGAGCGLLRFSSGITGLRIRLVGLRTAGANLFPCPACQRRSSLSGQHIDYRRVARVKELHAN